MLSRESNHHLAMSDRKGVWDHNETATRFAFKLADRTLELYVSRTGAAVTETDNDLAAVSSKGMYL